MSLLLYARMEGKSGVCVFWRVKRGTFDQNYWARTQISLLHTLEYLCLLSRYEGGEPLVNCEFFRYSGIPEIMEEGSQLIQVYFHQPFHSLFFIIQGRVCYESLLALCEQINNQVVTEEDVVEQFPELMDRCSKLPAIKRKN